MRKPTALFIVTMILFTVAIVFGQQPAGQPAPRRVQLSDLQVKMLADILQQIEALPEVKTLRARQDGIIAGIASASGMTRWQARSTDKGKIVIEEVVEPEKPQEGKP